ncbi:hypothetical protein RU97_GL001914 [Enterococcus canis]|uniref:Regulatory protein YycH-like domain-containing protein n=1 Tax=Enterococcus canis TaxID=214095 RepID=A0A1L8RFK5_9ENTE|nr:two-component system regulatory protein YycI [Enterococcus canis]OJG18517.1 hypothetical protein RU97_GL001914 [Enterococcus canis]
MDFKRIEQIFLLAFLGLNMFLFSIYHDGLASESSVGNLNQTEGIEKRLENDNIKYGDSLSTKIYEGYYLSGEETNLQQAVEQERKDSGNKNFLKENTTYKAGVLTNFPKENYFLKEEEMREGVNTFLTSNALLYGKEYSYLGHFSSLDGEYPEVVATQSFEEIPFNDETARLTLTLEPADNLWKITKYTQTHIGHIERLREKQELYTERDAIRTLYVNNRIPADSEIKWTQLAYARIYKVREKNVYVPVWFVAIASNGNNSQIEHVNAINNTIITNNTVQRVDD